MKVRLALICTKDPGFWHVYMSQSDTVIHEVIVEIPDLPLDYIVDRVMICDYEEKRKSSDEDDKAKNINNV